MQKDPENPYFELAAACVNYTGQHLFLTGKAGTGKTTFLHHIKKTTGKNAITVAPTGVAAINANGVTMHSFFHLPFTPFIPDTSAKLFQNGSYVAHNKNTLFNKLRYNKEKRKIINELELLIIDEVSMVRADMLDAIDCILRHFRRAPEKPFGGVQVLFIGDLYQLPPVVVNQEWQVLRNYYPSPFFFDAQVMREAPLLNIELKKIYRQSDGPFIDLLNKIRHNTISPDELEALNSYYNPTFKPSGEEQFITLCSHNYKAKQINDDELDALETKSVKFNAEIEGDFNESAYPAEEVLELKEGAQIMFIKNDRSEDKRYFNGKIGKIESIVNHQVRVSFPGQQESILIEKEEWKNIKYKYNAANKRLDEEVLGVFTQYPIRLAWAVTIHKSQGLTFDNAVIDAGESFSAGQVYVALSRMSGTKGLVLKSKIRSSSIQCDGRVVQFMEATEMDVDQLRGVIAQEQQKYIYNCIQKSFDCQSLDLAFREFAESHVSKKIPHQEEAEKLMLELSQKISNLKSPADTFILQLRQIIHSQEQSFGKLKERLDAAVDYFRPKLFEVIDALKIQMQLFKKERRVKKYLEEMHELLVDCEHKIMEIEQSAALAGGLAKGENQTALLDTRSETQRKTEFSAPPKITKTKAKKGESLRVTLGYFKQGKSPEEIAEIRGLTQGTVESHLISFVKTYELSIYEFLPKHKVNKILKEIELGKRKLGDLKSALPNEITFNEIRAVLTYFYNQEEKAENEAGK